MYKIYKNNENQNKFLIYLYKRKGGISDYIHGMIVSKNKETNEWRLIPSVVMEESEFLQEYNYKTDINLDNLIINHVLGALDII